MFKPVKRQSLSRSVFEQLSEQIVRGALSPGDSLPGERSLSDVLGVNRGAVREALKRLEQARLVMIQQGGATTVLNYLKTAGLDLLGQIVLTPNGEVDTVAIRSLMELRSALGPDIARRCAIRHDDAIAERLTSSLDRFLEATSPPDKQETTFELWQVLIDGSENIGYQLAFNTLRDAWGSVSPIMLAVMADELADEDGHEALVDSVIARNEAGAAGAAQELVQRSEFAVARILQPFIEAERRYVDIETILQEANDGN